MLKKIAVVLLILVPCSLQAESATAQEGGLEGHSEALGATGPLAAADAERNIEVALQYRAEGHLPQAIRLMEQTLQQHPRHATSRAVMADLLREKGDHEAALAMIDKAIALDDSVALFHVSRALMYLPFQRYDEALSDLDRAIALDPDLIAARFNRGSLLAQRERYEQALQDFDYCIAADPHLPAPYFNRGSVRYSLGMKEQAVADIEHFIKLTDNEDWKQSARELLQTWQERQKEAGETHAGTP
ncbi:MAG: tetratricopeptide repeat protein [Gammaproteobacteria bacterium]|jgi:tetratricopeptide (TPR) repeat protein